MATVLMAFTKGDRLEQVDETTGGAAPTQDVELNMKTGLRKEQVLIALQLITDKVIASKNFSP